MSWKVSFGFDVGSRLNRLGVGFLAWVLFPVAIGLGSDLNPPKPNPADPVDYYEWVNEQMGGELKDNAYGAYCTVCKRMKPFEGDFGEALLRPWSNNKAISDWLKANSQALSIFRRATEKPACYFPLSPAEPTGDPRLDHLMINTILPRLAGYRDAAKALVVQGHGAWAGGDRELLPKNILTVLKAGHHLGDGSPTIVGQLVGKSCGELAYVSLRGALSLSEDRDQLAAMILPELFGADPAWRPLGHACQFERVSAWDVCQRVFVPGGEPGTWTIYGPVYNALVQTAGFSADTRSQLARIGYGQTLAEFNNYYDAVAEWNATPYHLSAGQAGQLRRMVDTCANPFARELLPRLSDCRLSVEKSSTHRRATHLIVHLLAYHGKQGTFPDTLDQLDIPDLEELRVDPFSGGDLVYKPRGADFSLYSVWENLADDGGRHDEQGPTGDFVFWPMQERG